MKFYIVIPAHNEAAFIGQTLQSIASQTLLPKKVIVVNDNSTDETQSIVEDFQKKHNWIHLINTTSSNKHLPGSKIINAFYKGFETLDEKYDVICKYDADLVFPENYLERLAFHFNNNPKLGMTAGYCHIKQNGKWIIEGVTGKNHIRGALKAYRKQCFLDIGKLKNAMGWDTIDELLAKYYKWEYSLDETLKVNHLKPTGSNYDKASKHLQGEAIYRMRYGLILSVLIGLHMSLKRGRISFFKDFLFGYMTASKQKKEPLVTIDQGRFIRKLRWESLLGKLGL